MVELAPVDSLWMRLPFLEQYPIPAASLWAIVGAAIAALVSLVGSLSIAYFVYRLARHQFRSNRWWEKQERRYTAVANHFVTIRDAGDKLAMYDHPDVMEEDVTVTYTPEQNAEFRKQVREAQEAIKKEIRRGLFLLSPSALHVLGRYISDVERIDPATETYPDGEAAQIARHAEEEFSDLAQRDLGAPGLWLVHRKAGYAALRDRLDHLWYPWSPRRHESNIRSVHNRRLAKQRGYRPRKLPESLKERAKKWIVENFTIRK